MRVRFSKKQVASILNVAFLVIIINILFFPNFIKYQHQGNNHFTIKMDGEVVGVVDDTSKIYDLYRRARLEIAGEYGEMVMIDYPGIEYVGKEVNWGEVDSDREIIANMKAMLVNRRVETLSHAYCVKVNDIVVDVASAEDVKSMFDDALWRYDTKKKYESSICTDTGRELDVLTVSVNRVDGKDETSMPRISAGVETALEVDTDGLPGEPDSFDDFELGIDSMAFSETIEVAEAYVPEDKITPADEARNLLTENQETQRIYTVQSGDTLSEISLSVGLPLDDIIALNPELENENSCIYVDQELIITVPKPAVSVLWNEKAKVEEAYELPIEYVYNDEWYTNQSVTHQQPSAGYHEAVVEISHENEDLTNEDVLYEEVDLAAVPKIVEIGTIVPPTYIKPISGGRLSSGFGKRNAPTKGASTYHKGVDWATPIGTSVCASSGGTVVFAGWGSGYGNVVYINHPDGRQTRYGHLSHIYCSVGDYVSQGEVIAASGNTGRSTGPHLHFEILIGGSQVNPLEYLY